MTQKKILIKDTHHSPIFKLEELKERNIKFRDEMTKIRREFGIKAKSPEL